MVLDIFNFSVIIVNKISLYDLWKWFDSRSYRLPFAQNFLYFSPCVM